MYNLSVQEVVQHMLDNGVMLSQTSLDAIRQLVREEVRKALAEADEQDSLALSLSPGEIHSVLLALDYGISECKSSDTREDVRNVRERLMKLLEDMTHGQVKVRESK